MRSTSAASTARTSSGAISLLMAALGQGLGDAHRRLHAQVRLDEQVLQLLQRIRVELPLGEDAGDILRQPGRRLGQACLEALEPALLWAASQQVLSATRLQRQETQPCRFAGTGSLGLAPERAEQSARFCRLVVHAAHLVAATSPRNRLPVDPVTRAVTSVPGTTGTVELQLGESAACAPAARARPAPSTCEPIWLPRWAARAASPARLSRAARSLTAVPGTCGMRAAGVPVRGENGNTCRKVKPQSSTRPQ